MKTPNPLVTAIIPVYNEEEHLGECLRSLLEQTYRRLEIVVVDDGSTDRTAAIARKAGVLVLQQSHVGKALAIAAGSASARGEILAFLDGDLRFEHDFIEELVRPIIANECLGTSHAQEFVANSENVWSRCLQLVSGLPPDRRLDLSEDEVKQGTVVYRAVRTQAFNRVGGFEDVGYLDDQTLARKLGQNAHFVKGAVCYHHNPGTLQEVFSTGIWRGKSVWHRRQWRGLRDYLPLRAIVRGLRAAVQYRFPPLAIYVPVVETGIFWGVAKRILGVDRTYGA